MPASVVAITGSPGTGKTSVGNRLRQMGFFVMNLFDFAKKYDCLSSFDEHRDSYIIDDEKLQHKLTQYLHAGHGLVIIESHYADLIPEEFVIKCYVLSAPIKVLRKRYEEREYARDKIEENIQAEIMQVCWVDALDAFGPSKVTKIENMSIEEIADLISLYSQVDLDG
jgi:adenylate kinase